MRMANLHRLSRVNIQPSKHQLVSILIHFDCLFVDSAVGNARVSVARSQSPALVWVNSIAEGIHNGVDLIVEDIVHLDFLVMAFNIEFRFSKCINKLMIQLYSKN